MILQIGDYICACETQQFFKEHQFIANEETGKELNDQIDDWFWFYASNAGY